MMKDQSDGARMNEGSSATGKLPWQAPKIDSVKGRTASNSFSSFSGSDGTYYS